ncbi:Panacea domain-containing protein [Pseudoduganella namucuonensis]|uniref:Uncharacterized phage-associated protein n=1 Tax=Pseudoduganella namucuonensis TaxID=1035707 RepID=A0A1I7LKX0_9BURK|nr:type II toxin-antitoxin system antitoxin SocA domain-containing protein [Pseudoduganella namucuonensis]SFV10321.1 Uncharacterized phage-associated protein [Pseudoduganella namucuonensis]
MAYSAMAVANALVKRAKEGKVAHLSPMKLQKLLFYVQSWHLAKQGRPLIDDFFCRWKYGPVIPSLYHEFKEYGPNPITAYGGHIVEEEGALTKRRPIVSEQDTRTWELIDEILAEYGAYSGSTLSTMTHEKDSAWSTSGGVDGNPIPNDMLREATLRDGRFKARGAA